MELLAPAGSLEAFEAAVAAGADAVYIGAPEANARALSRDFSPPELAAMLRYAGGRRVRVYAAMNSLLKEDELDKALATVQLLAGLGIDALIIQDLGLYALCRRHFPDLRLHASTLMGAHNSLAVSRMSAMGFARVVLAREMSLAEIAAIARRSPVELEVFVHGAMCFSFSGLCQFSSYLGGKSSLRGRCVQPCRRQYSWGEGRRRKSGYLFSMNDLEALELLPELAACGVGSVKIEGRMKSALYVDRVVRAYRLVLDALAAGGAALPAGHVPLNRKLRKLGSDPNFPASGQKEPGAAARLSGALAQGRELLREAMGRRTGSGFFSLPPKDLITPAHSGNIGLFIGKIARLDGPWATLAARHPLKKGDRLRLHREAGGERQAFTLKELAAPAGGDRGGRNSKGGGRGVQGGDGATVKIRLPGPAQVGDAIYQVDLAERRQRAAAKRQLVVTEADRRRPAALPALRVPGGGGSRAERHGNLLSVADFSPANGPRPKITGGRVARNGTLAKQKLAGPGERSGGRREARARGGAGRRSATAGPGSRLTCWLKLDDPVLLKQRLPDLVSRVVLPLGRESLERFAAGAAIPRSLRDRIIWSLPPLIWEDDLVFFREQIANLLAEGFKAWQLGHWGQLEFFTAMAGDGATALELHADYTCNLLNSQALAAARAAGFKSAQAALEIDRESLALLARNLGAAPDCPRQLSQRKIGGNSGFDPNFSLGLTVYGRPPLFTSRLDSIHFRYRQPFFSPREEKFILLREEGLTLALADRPFSLLPYWQELAVANLAYAVIDLRRQHHQRRDLPRLLRQLGQKQRDEQALSSFNYLHGLA